MKLHAAQQKHSACRTLERVSRGIWRRAAKPVATKWHVRARGLFELGQNVIDRSGNLRRLIREPREHLAHDRVYNYFHDSLIPRGPRARGARAMGVARFGFLRSGHRRADRLTAAARLARDL
jgi:hypothetical protein